MRAIAVKPGCTWSGETADAVMLDYDGRHRRRMAMTGAKGLAFVLDLPAVAALHDGDALVLEAKLPLRESRMGKAFKVD